MSRWFLQPVDFKRNGVVVSKYVENPGRFFVGLRERLGDGAGKYTIRQVTLNTELIDFLREHYRTEGYDAQGVSADQVDYLKRQKLIWVGVFERDLLVGCVSLREVVFKCGNKRVVYGSLSGELEVGYVDHLTVRKQERGRRVSWLLIWAVVEIGVSCGMGRFMFCHDEVISKLPYSAAVRVRVYAMPVEEFVDVSYDEGIRRAVFAVMDKGGWKQGLSDVGCEVGRRMWRIFLVAGMFLVVGYSANANSRNVGGLWVHWCVPVSEVEDVEIGGFGEGVRGGGFDVWVPRHYGNRGLFDGVDGVVMTEASSMMIYEQNWSSGRVWKEGDCWVDFT